MRKIIQRLLDNETLCYIIFGVAAMLVAIVSRTIIFSFTYQATLATIISDILAVIFAFATNDHFVFKQVRQGWQQRFVKFAFARLFTTVLNLLLSFTLVDTYPQLIGQFVNHDLEKVNFIETLIAQFLIIALNYILSKFLIFKGQKKSSQ